VANYTLSKITAEIILNEAWKNSASDEEIKELLRTTFTLAEKGYLNSIDDLLATKQQLQYQLQDLTQFEISQKYQDVLNKLNTINKDLSIGSSVLISLIANNKLFIANLGTCRALLVKNDIKNDVLRVIQVTVDHNLFNDDEIARFFNLGLDVSALQSLPTTRCIGNYMGKGGYKDSPVLSQSSGEPLTSYPEIIGGIQIDSSVRFLLLLSAGLCKVLSQLFSHDLNIVNKELVQIVVQEFNKQSTLNGVAQSVITQLAQMHQDFFMKSKVNGIESTFDSREDMTLLIRNFSFPLPNSIENSSSTKSSNASSTIFGTQFDTITSYSSTNTSQVNYGSCLDRKTKPYVSFKEYFANVEKARAEGKLPPGIDFDEAPLE
jgi:TAK1-binding protein 1